MPTDATTPDRDPGWPVDDFRDYLRKLMMKAGIETYAELSRLADINETQLSRWHRGMVQPSRESLNRIAPVLHVKPVQLYLAAGILTEDDVNTGSRTPDPATLAELRELYWDDRLTRDEQTHLDQSIRLLIAGLRAQIDAREAGQRPRRRRRA